MKIAAQRTSELWTLDRYESMGSDIIGVFGHKIPFPPPESLAQSMRDGIQPVSPIIHNEWLLDSDFTSTRLIRIHDDLSVYFGPHSGFISTGREWPGPKEDIGEKQMVISAVRAVASFFRSPSVIFLPDDNEPWCDIDSWIADGLTLEELQQRLAGIQEPSADFHAAIRQNPDSWDADGYVIEQLNYDTV